MNIMRKTHEIRRYYISKQIKAYFRTRTTWCIAWLDHKQMLVGSSWRMSANEGLAEQWARRKVLPADLPPFPLATQFSWGGSRPWAWGCGWPSAARANLSGSPQSGLSTLSKGLVRLDFVTCPNFSARPKDSHPAQIGFLYFSALTRLDFQLPPWQPSLCPGAPEWVGRHWRWWWWPRCWSQWSSWPPSSCAPWPDPPPPPACRWTGTGTGPAGTGCQATGFLGKAELASCLLVASLLAALGSWSGTFLAQLLGSEVGVCLLGYRGTAERQRLAEELLGLAPTTWQN